MQRPLLISRKPPGGARAYAMRSLSCIVHARNTTRRPENAIDRAFVRKEGISFIAQEENKPIYVSDAPSEQEAQENSKICMLL